MSCDMTCDMTHMTCDMTDMTCNMFCNMTRLDRTCLTQIIRVTLSKHYICSSAGFNSTRNRCAPPCSFTERNNNKTVVISYLKLCGLKLSRLFDIINILAAKKYVL